MADFRTRLYLVTPRIRTVADFLPRLDAALGGADIACVLLRLADPPAREAKELVKQLAPKVQSHGAALLVEDARLAAHTGADGVHVTGMGEVFTEALDSLKPERIVGVGSLASRDDAMRAGEAGADYLMFGEGGAPASQTLDEVGWWAEIFNVPCVGVASALADVEALGAAGAEFVALGEAVWGDPRGPATAVAEAEAALARAAARLAGAPV